MKMAKDMFNPEMMKKYSEVGVKVQALQTELASTEVECTTADGSVTIKVSGTQAPAGVTVTDALCATGAEAASATLTQALKDAHMKSNNNRSAPPPSSVAETMEEVVQLWGDRIKAFIQ